MRIIFLDFGGVTHLVYAALHEVPGLFAGWVDEEAIERNGAMLRNLFGPLSEAAPSSSRFPNCSAEIHRTFRRFAMSGIENPDDVKVTEETSVLIVDEAGILLQGLSYQPAF